MSAQLYRNLQVRGLEAFGRAVSVDQTDFLFDHARILYTANPAVGVVTPESDGAKIAHNSPISTQNADRWKPVWTYMLTEPAP